MSPDIQRGLRHDSSDSLDAVPSYLRRNEPRYSEGIKTSAYSYRASRAPFGVEMSPDIQRGLRLQPYYLRIEAGIHAVEMSPDIQRGLRLLFRVTCVGGQLTVEMSPDIQRGLRR